MYYRISLKKTYVILYFKKIWLLQNTDFNLFCNSLNTLHITIYKIPETYNVKYTIINMPFKIPPITGKR